MLNSSLEIIFVIPTVQLVLRSVFLIKSVRHFFVNNNFNIILSDYPSKLDIINYNTLIITGILNFYNYCVRGYNNLYLNEFNNVQRLIYGLRNEITLKIIKLYIEPWVRQNDAILKKNYKLFARKTALLQKDKMQNVKCIKLYFKKLDLH